MEVEVYLMTLVDLVMDSEMVDGEGGRQVASLAVDLVLELTFQIWGKGYITSCTVYSIMYPCPHVSSSAWHIHVMFNWCE